MILSEIANKIKEANLHIIIKDGKLVSLDGTIKFDNVYVEDIAEFLNCVNIHVFNCHEGVCKATIDYSWC